MNYLVIEFDTKEDYDEDGTMIIAAIDLAK